MNLIKATNHYQSYVHYYYLLPVAQLKPCECQDA